MTRDWPVRDERTFVRYHMVRGSSVGNEETVSRARDESGGAGRGILEENNDLLG